MKDREDTYLQKACDARGVTIEEHETKMRNLAKFGCTVIKALRHNRYIVRGHLGTYDPYTDTWMEPTTKKDA